MTSTRVTAVRLWITSSVIPLRTKVAACSDVRDNAVIRTADLRRVQLLPMAEVARRNYFAHRVSAASSPV